MHDDGRYDDPRVTGSAGDPVSRETEYPNWRPSEVPQSPPEPGRNAPTSGVPWSATGEGRDGADASGRPVNASPDARVIPIRRNPSASARLEAAAAHPDLRDGAGPSTGFRHARACGRVVCVSRNRGRVRFT
ncbi:hypothetical protein GCM10029963_46840 [Micromonospora andamanensis]